MEPEINSLIDRFTFLPGPLERSFTVFEKAQDKVRASSKSPGFFWIFQISGLFVNPDTGTP